MKNMIAIIDYGVGNIFSLASTFKMLGKDVVLTDNPQKIKDADRLILPGVGAFADAAEKLRSKDMFNLLTEQAKTTEKGLKIPHIGWNSLTFAKKSPLFKNINDGDFVYFVHSFHGTACEESAIAYTSYGGQLTAAVSDGNVFGTQFHPEKSGEVGLKILSAFCDI